MVLKSPRLVGSTGERYGCSIAETVRNERWLKAKNRVEDDDTKQPRNSNEEEDTNYFKSAQW